MDASSGDDAIPSSSSSAKDEVPEAVHTEEEHDSRRLPDNCHGDSDVGDAAAASEPSQDTHERSDESMGHVSHSTDAVGDTDNGDTGNGSGTTSTHDTTRTSTIASGQSAESSPRRKLLKKAPTHFYSARPVGLPYVTAPYRPKYAVSPSSKPVGSPRKHPPKPLHDPAPHPNDLTPDEYDLYEPPPTTKTGEGEEDSAEDTDDPDDVEPVPTGSPKKKTTNQKLMTKAGARPAPKYSKQGPTGNVRADPSKKKYFSPINESLLKPLSSTPRNRKVWSLDIPIVRQREKDEMEKTLTRVSDISVASSTTVQAPE